MRTKGIPPFEHNLEIRFDEFLGYVRSVKRTDLADGTRGASGTLVFVKRMLLREYRTLYYIQRGKGIAGKIARRENLV